MRVYGRQIEPVLAVALRRPVDRPRRRAAPIRRSGRSPAPSSGGGSHDGALSLGLPRMHKEAGERRDFLPNLVAAVVDLGAASSSRASARAWASPTTTTWTWARTWRSARTRTPSPRTWCWCCAPRRSPAPAAQGRRSSRCCTSRPGPPGRAARAGPRRDLARPAHRRHRPSARRRRARRRLERSRGSLRRARARVAEFASPTRPAIRVTVLGAGMIGKDAVEAATKYGNLDRARRLRAARGGGHDRRPQPDRSRGVHEGALRPSPTCWSTRPSGTIRAADRAERLARLPAGARRRLRPRGRSVPLHESPPTVRGIEGIPQGDLDRWAFAPDDPAWDDVPDEVDRRIGAGSSRATRGRACIHMRAWSSTANSSSRCSVPCSGQGGWGTLVRGEYHERALWRAACGSWVEHHAAAVVTRRVTPRLGALSGDDAPVDRHRPRVEHRLAHLIEPVVVVVGVVVEQHQPVDLGPPGERGDVGDARVAPADVRGTPRPCTGSRGSSRSARWASAYPEIQLGAHLVEIGAEPGSWSVTYASVRPSVLQPVAHGGPGMQDRVRRDRSIRSSTARSAHRGTTHRAGTSDRCTGNSGGEK